MDGTRKSYSSDTTQTKKNKYDIFSLYMLSKAMISKLQYVESQRIGIKYGTMGEGLISLGKREIE